MMAGGQVCEELDSNVSILVDFNESEKEKRPKKYLVTLLETRAPDRFLFLCFFLVHVFRWVYRRSQ